MMGQRAEMQQALFYEFSLGRKRATCTTPTGRRGTTLLTLLGPSCI